MQYYDIPYLHKNNNNLINFNKFITNTDAASIGSNLFSQLKENLEFPTHNFDFEVTFMCIKKYDFSDMNAPSVSPDLPSDIYSQSNIMCCCSGVLWLNKQLQQHDQL